ncbi:MAG TPA: cupin domain-containing protein, partial [Steroidobacteraceae bacterium]|nr:cupin domain-containing protein [Steroidobacteraceae bacterium]
ELIDALRLAPHPEGGFYRETWRSPSRVSAGPRPERSALTTIYFLLTDGGFSAWHRVRSDEVWNWHEGGALELLLAPGDCSRIERRRLGPVEEGREPAATVPAGWWQAARPLGDYALCGCIVAPGFEFEDFTFLRDDGAATAALSQIAPELVALL